MSSLARIDLDVPSFVLDGHPSCAEVDPELFFPQEVEVSSTKVVSKYVNLASAKQICSTCPLSLQCLEYALNNYQIGVWGGTTESQREGLRKKSGIKANRRVPTPTSW